MAHTLPQIIHGVKRTPLKKNSNIYIHTIPTFRYKTMSQEFRKNITVPGTAFLGKVHITGKVTQATTYVVNDDDDGKTATYTVDDEDNIIAVASKATVSKTITLPDPSENEGRMIWIFDDAAHAATVNIDIEYSTTSISITANNGYKLVTAIKFWSGTAYSFKWVELLTGTYTNFS